MKIHKTQCFIKKVTDELSRRLSVQYCTDNDQSRPPLGQGASTHPHSSGWPLEVLLDEVDKPIGGGIVRGHGILVL